MKKLDRGIVLITTMLLLSFIIMIAALLVVTGRNTMLLGASYSDREQALYAADSGLAYVQYCLTQNKNWSAAGVYDPGISGLQVETVQPGLVHGILDGGRGEFYVAFYDGTWNAGDVRTDAIGNDMKYYSYNNLASDASGIFSIKDTSGTKFREIPANGAHIIVEGRSNQIRRYVEAMLVPKPPPGGCAARCGGGVDIDLADTSSVFLVDTTDDSGLGSDIKSMGNINIDSGDTTDKNCFQISGVGMSYTGDSTATSYYSIVNTEEINPGTEEDDYGIKVDNGDQTAAVAEAKLKWSDVTKDYFSTSTTYNGSNVKINIPGGTYVYKQDPAKPDEYNLCYLDENYDPATTNLKSATAFDSGSITGAEKALLKINTAPKAADFDDEKKYLFLLESKTGKPANAGITASSTGKESFALLVADTTDGGATYTISNNYRSSFRLDKEKKGDSSGALLSKPGKNIYIGGELSGQGSVLSGGALNFQGKSIMQADPDAGITIYSRGTVSVDPVVGSGGTSDPNDAIKMAWNKYATAFPPVGGYYQTDEDDYKKVKDEIVKTKIDYLGHGLKELKDVLKDEYGYDDKASKEMVNTLLAKNSYIGEDSSGGSGSVDYTATDSGIIGDDGSSFDRTQPGDTEFECSNGQIYKVFFQAFGCHDEILIVKKDLPNQYYRIGFQTAVGYYPAAPVNVSSGLSGITYARTGQRDGWVDFDVGADHFKLEVNDANGVGTAGYDCKITGTVDGGGPAQSSAFIMLLGASDPSWIPLTFNDTLLKGVVYTWEDFKADDLKGSSLCIRGGIIAYGGEPDNSGSDTPGSNGKGNIILKGGKFITFTYDKDYMTNLFTNMSIGTDSVRTLKASFEGDRAKNQL